MLALDDIQGIVLHGYADKGGTFLPEAAFLPAAIADAHKARAWLAGMLDGITSVQQARAGVSQAVNVAFTYTGFERLDLPESALESFGREFYEGMGAEARSRALGDTHGSAPEKWQWGGPDAEQTLHLLILCYAESGPALQTLIRRIDKESRGALRLSDPVDSTLLYGDKEHFGFRDGISQPEVAGYDTARFRFNRVRAGEFVLGYPNEYGRHPLSPLVKKKEDPHGILPQAQAPDAPGWLAKCFGRLFAPANPLAGYHNFGMNGSYLVFRRLSQDVTGFWKFLDETANGDPAERDRLGAKMVGRWRNGVPLTSEWETTPEDADESLCTKNDFRYHGNDKHGFKCPFGSHIRRTNPRDSLKPNPGEAESLKVNRRHRILRRGRPYGTPLDPELSSERMLKASKKTASEERGLNFLCFNANIGRQFEFIQQTWANNRKFTGLYNDADPLIGDHNPRNRGATGTFTEQAEPVRKRHTGLSRFTHVRAGGYFFMPGKTALRYLSRL